MNYLYGHIAREGETPTHTIDGVDYAAAEVPDIDTFWTDELKAKYPYAFILKTSITYGFYASSKKPKVYVSSDSNDGYFVYNEGRIPLKNDETIPMMMASIYRSESPPAWDDKREGMASPWVNVEYLNGMYEDDKYTHILLWTSFNVYDTSSALRFSTLDPIPVGGETPEPPVVSVDIHPASFMEGLQIGQAVRAML